MRTLQYIFMTLSAMLLATPAFAQGSGISPFAPIGAGIGMGIASGLCGIGQGIGVKGACEGLARNPEAGGKLTTTLILGLAFIESLAIYALVVCLILLFVKPLGA